MKEIILNSKARQQEAIDTINLLEVDGSMVVQIKKVDKSGTAAQRRLYWLWVKEISESGIGRHDTVEEVHLEQKWEFCLPILKEEDEVFGILYGAFRNAIEGSLVMSEACKIFCKDYISTERLTRKQRARMLTEMQRKWTREGVNLTDPDNFGKDLLKYA